MRKSYRMAALLSAFGLVCSVHAQKQPPPFGPTIARIEVKQGSATSLVKLDLDLAGAIIWPVDSARK